MTYVAKHLALSTPSKKLGHTEIGAGTIRDHATPGGFAWFVRLRFVVMAAQLTAAVVCFILLHQTTAAGSLLSLAVLTGSSNLVLLRNSGQLSSTFHPADRTVFVYLLLDTGILTISLFVTGSESNPFTVFYLVHVVVAALLLDVRKTWFIAFATSLAFASLFVLPSTSMDSLFGHHHASALHLQGMWLAYTLGACFIGHFVSRMQNALRIREQQLAHLREQAALAERLAWLSSVAANAAHDLGTPLSTIALVANELDRKLSTDPDVALGEDARLIRDEVERCRSIVQRMGVRAGAEAGEMPRSIALSDLGNRLTEMLGAKADSVQIRLEGGTIPVVIPLQATATALLNLVKNSLDAHAEVQRTEPVIVDIAVRQGHLVCEVLDRGPGLTAAAEQRFGEPFFSTKDPDKGMGLGVFLVRSFAQRIGGKLEFQQRAGGGMGVCLSLPENVLVHPHLLQP